MGQSPCDCLDRMAPKDWNLKKQSGTGGYPSQTLHQWGTSTAESRGGCHPGNVIVRLVCVEKRAHNWRLKRAIVEDVDPHSCARRHHKGIQHWVKAPLPNQEINKDHHFAQILSLFS